MVFLLSSCAVPLSAPPTNATTPAMPTAILTSPTALAPATPPESPEGVLPLVEFETLAAQVQRVRGLEARRPLLAKFVTAPELERLTSAALAVEWPETALSRRVPLDAFLGLGREAPAPPAHAAQPAFVAPAGAVFALPGSLTPDAFPVLACAFDQALVMQSFAEVSPEALAGVCPDDPDACLARRALIAGDAALLAEQWWRTFSEDRSMPPAAPVTCSAMPLADGPPAGMLDLMLFPPQAGLSFVRTLYLAGGWAAVDAAYAGPPLTTEHILHPERYPQDTPRPPDVPDLSAALGPGWATQDSGPLGEWRTLQALQIHLDRQLSEQAAAGWDGDRYVILDQPEAGMQAWLLLTRWDTVRDAHEFFGAFRTYGERRFGVPLRTSTSLTWEVDSAVVVLHVGNDQTLWIQAPTLDAADALRLASGFPLH